MGSTCKRALSTEEQGIPVYFLGVCMGLRENSGQQDSAGLPWWPREGMGPQVHRVVELETLSKPPPSSVLVTSSNGLQPPPPSSFLLLVVRPGALSSVLAPTSDALCS